MSPHQQLFNSTAPTPEITVLSANRRSAFTIRQDRSLALGRPTRLSESSSPSRRDRLAAPQSALCLLIDEADDYHYLDSLTPPLRQFPLRLQGHSSPTKATTQPIPQPRPFPILSLPAELRFYIYANLLDTNKFSPFASLPTTDDDNDTTTTTTTNNNHSLSLLRTSHFISNELTHHLLALHTWHFDIHSRTDIEHFTNRFSSTTTTTTNSTAPLIHHLSFTLHDSLLALDYELTPYAIPHPSGIGHYDAVNMHVRPNPLWRLFSCVARMRYANRFEVRLGGEAGKKGLWDGGEAEYDVLGCFERFGGELGELEWENRGVVPVDGEVDGVLVFVKRV
ncbi:hypothetical protein MMC20_003709 [Loxospora ochrophaea]|nr:hypothetical protein [Loxospora ochrophaea]